MELLWQVGYGLAVLMYASLPPAILYWLLIHPFADFWRRIGVRWTYIWIGSVCMVAVLALASQHERVLAVRYPFHWALAVVGLALYAVAIALEVTCRRHLKFKTLAGVPEIRGDSRALLTEGIFARTRNPRYLALLFGVAGFALILNYLALYLLFVFLVPAIYAVILLEERELHQRFGAEYAAYVHRVPRLLPSWR